MTNKNQKIIKAFGKKLRRLRTEKGFSTRKFAKLAGISPSSLGRLEAGLSNPSLTTLLKLAEALKIGVGELAGGTGGGWVDAYMIQRLWHLCIKMMISIGFCKYNICRNRIPMHFLYAAIFNFKRILIIV